MRTQLVGRETELASILAATARGSGVVISGPPGVGKTALARAAAQHVQAGAGRVEWLVATEASRLIPFGALAPLLADDVGPFHPAGVLSTINRCHGGRDGRCPTLVVVDDAHLLDDHSAAALLGLVASAGGRVIATVRSGETAPGAVRSLWKDGLLASCDVAPFDLSATREFLAASLDGAIAAGTAVLLWQHTRGNALFLKELVRQARLENYLVHEHGVWLWRGEPALSPHLADLVDRRFDGLDLTSLDALGLLVLAEPLTLPLLAEIVGIDGMAELETRRIVEIAERRGVLWYRFAHPMLAAAAARLISPAQRRRLADTLVEVAGDDERIDLVRRAMWHLDGSGPPDVDLLVDAARAVFLTQPALARRLAARAQPHATSPHAALLVANTSAELGEFDAARDAQAAASAYARTDADRLAVQLNDVSLTAFSQRRPDLGLDLLAAARTDWTEAQPLEIDLMAAQLLVFSARPVDALAVAERVLGAAAPSRNVFIHACNVRVMALALTDRSSEALAAASELLADVGSAATLPYAAGIAHIAASVAGFVHWVDQAVPAIKPHGRWPVPADSADPVPSGEPFHFPLFDGARRLIEGHATQAIPPLREAVAQQLSGEGVLRSEAVACLVVALAATSQCDEAQRLLAESPPDRVAIFAGLRPWAESAVAAATGRPEAVARALEAYEEARTAGSPINAVAYLATVADYGAVNRAAALLDDWAPQLDAPLSAARAQGIRARATGDGGQLLDAAERHAQLGLLRDALGMAELAGAALGTGRSKQSTRAKALAGDMRRRLDRRESGPCHAIGLTRRELEVARLAAKGMTDREIADLLVVSVRTVESHLAATYRKLALTSRRDLRTAVLPVA